MFTRTRPQDAKKSVSEMVSLAKGDPISIEWIAIGIYKLFLANDMRSSQVENRFWNRVSKTDRCWNWIGATNRYGYGKMMIDGRRELVHRISWRLAKHREPRNCVLHHCDNRRCVRPDHLFEGTKSDNALDRHSKHRDAVGVRHGRYTKPERTARGVAITRSKLDEEKVKFIRDNYQTIRPYKIAKLLGINYTCVYKINKGETWKHVGV